VDDEDGDGHGVGVDGLHGDGGHGLDEEEEDEGQQGGGGQLLLELLLKHLFFCHLVTNHIPTVTARPMIRMTMVIKNQRIMPESEPRSNPEVHSGSAGSDDTTSFGSKSVITNFLT